MIFGVEISFLGGILFFLDFFLRFFLMKQKHIQIIGTHVNFTI